MIFAGSAAFSCSNRSSSIMAASFENTLKFTPPGRTVAPRGALAPDEMRKAVSGSTVLISPAAVTRLEVLQPDPLALGNAVGVDVLLYEIENLFSGREP